MNVSKRPLGVVLCVLALTGAACSTTGKGEETSGGPGPTDAPATTVDGTGPATTDAKSPTPTTEAKTTTTTKPATGGTVEVIESGFSIYKDYEDADTATAGAVIENTSKNPAVFFDVVFTFLDEAGKPLGTQTTYVDNLEAGAKGYAVVDYVEVDGKVDRIEVDAVADAENYFEGTSLAVEVGSVGPESYGEGTVIKGTATNDTDELMENFSVTCVLRVKKKIVGGAEGYLDKILPGKSIAWEARGTVKADAADCAASSSD